MVRTMTEVIERGRKNHDLDDPTRSFLANTFSVGRDGKTPLKRRHHKDCTGQLLLNAANSIPDSF